LAGTRYIMSGTKGKGEKQPKKSQKTAKKVVAAKVPQKIKPTTRAKTVAESPKAKAPRKPKPPVNKFQPTGDQRNLVMLGAATGMTEKEITALINNPDTGRPIAISTLREHFADELDNGEAKVAARVAGNLVTIASSGTHKSAVTAAIFWLKTRRRWREPEPEFVERRRTEVEREKQLADGSIERIRFTLVLEEPKEAPIDATATVVA
jgi:hypothetical protein